MTDLERMRGNAPIIGFFFTYDALGRRVSKTPAGGTTVFYYDGARVIEERVGGATTATYVYGNYVDEVLARDSAGQRLFYHQNALWSVHALTDAAGGVVERYSYDPYGQLCVLSADYQPLSTSPLAYFTFTGREYLADLALYDYRHRFYSPSLGRFLQTDPTRFEAEDVNLYRYCDNNSLNYTDFIGADIYYSSSGGAHADLIIDDPRSTTGQTFYDFGPQSGDRDNWTWNQLYGPSKISLVPWRGKIPDSYIRIPTTHKQDAAAILMASLSEGRPYSVAFNNCAHMARLIIRCRYSHKDPYIRYTQQIA